jgi:hypothetical protein
MWKNERGPGRRFGAPTQLWYEPNPKPITDEIFVDVDPVGVVVLTTDDGNRVTNRIELDPAAWQRLLQVLVDWKMPE